jgi:hypothetical protein
MFSFVNTCSAGLKKKSMGARKRGGEDIEKILLTDRAVPTLFKQVQRKYFLDRGKGFVSISNVKVFFPTCVIYKKDSGDEHNFCATLMEKTVGENSNFYSAANCEGIQKSLLAGDTTALDIKPGVEQGTQMGTETNIF